MRIDLHAKGYKSYSKFNLPPDCLKARSRKYNLLLVTYKSHPNTLNKYAKMIIAKITQFVAYMKLRL